MAKWNLGKVKIETMLVSSFSVARLGVAPVIQQGLAVTCKVIFSHILPAIALQIFCPLHPTDGSFYLGKYWW